MAIEHISIADANLHEPKGIASAGSGEVYIADGTGSGAWTELHHGTVYSEATQTVTGATTWTDVAFELQGHIEGPSHSISTNNHEITITQAGHYMVHYTILADSASGSSVVEARFCVDGAEVAGSTGCGTIGASDQKSISRALMVDLALNEVLSLQFYSDTVNGRLIYPGSGATSQVTAILSLNQIAD